ncbi:hypothetical protein CCHOA_09850 [Corynebacterium choanae]|uniref:Uncharacterized protein n=1 Tax=Corynebacterium choanae TaxID=1862358 RepID=A0A3G6J9B0_9CORY|nr:hypothetical protein CCHOA_09850 [Corynebacterium choanae]
MKQPVAHAGQPHPEDTHRLERSDGAVVTAGQRGDLLLQAKLSVDTVCSHGDAKHARRDLDVERICIKANDRVIRLPQH